MMAFKARRRRLQAYFALQIMSDGLTSSLIVAREPTFEGTQRYMGDLFD